SITLPVTFEETVARRRAVTYPDAFSTDACVPAARSVTLATSTSTGRSRVNQYHAPPPAPPSSRSNTTHFTHRPPPAWSGSRSIFRADRSSISATDQLPRYGAQNDTRRKSEK